MIWLNGLLMMLCMYKGSKFIAVRRNSSCIANIEGFVKMFVHVIYVTQIVSDFYICLKNGHTFINL